MPTPGSRAILANMPKTSAAGSAAAAAAKFHNNNRAAPLAVLSAACLLVAVLQAQPDQCGAIFKLFCELASDLDITREEGSYRELSASLIRVR